MARTDKTESAIGVTRAPLDVDIDKANWGKALGVGIDTNGHAVIGAGNSGVVGVAVFDKTNWRAGTPCDIFGNGSEIVEVEGLAAGTRYNVMADGTVSTDDTESDGTTATTPLGYTVEADRLVVTL